MANEMILKNGLRTTSLRIGSYSLPTSSGTLDQILKVDSSGNLIFADNTASGINNVVEDLTPQLGGNLDIQNFTITTSTIDGDIVLSPGGTGVINVSSTRIINVADPIAANNAATKGYTDNLVDTKIGSVVDDLTPELGGDLTIGDNTIIAGEALGITLVIDDGKPLRVGGLDISAPAEVFPVEVTANTEYTFTFDYPKIKRSTYIDYLFISSTGSKMGTLFVLCDGTNVSITDMGTELGTPSIDFVATVLVDDVIITGTNLALVAPSNLKITMRQMS
jgi:hypothetical protein